MIFSGKIKKAKASNEEVASIDGRYESKNIIVYLTSDTEHNTPYIFSISSFVALAELHYFDEDFNLSYETWKATDFLGITDEKRYIFFSPNYHKQFKKLNLLILPNIWMLELRIILLNL